jgi:hypothetical protein
MSLSVREILDEHSRLVSMRTPEEPQWREIATLIKPDERDIGTWNKRIRVADEIFDSTPLQALDQFVGGLFSQATSPADRWFELGIDDKDLQAWGPVKDYLWNLATMALSSFGPALSNFYAMVPAAFADLGAFGLGTMYSDIDLERRRFRDIAIPLAEAYVDTDGEGGLIRFDREYAHRGAQAKVTFGDRAPAIEDSREIHVVHAVFRNPEHRPGALGPKGKPWSSVYCSPDLPEWRIDGGFYELPYHSIPWTLRGGRAYPTGPGHIARADVSMLNEMERDHIVAANFAADPVHLLHDKSIYTAADIRPGEVLYGMINENGKPMMQTYQTGADVKLSMAQSEQRRSAIREAYLFSIMQLVNRPQMTATEFLGFKEEQLRLMAPNLGRIHSYGLQPLIARRIRMMQRAGLVPPPAPELAREAINIGFTSPLAKAQKAAQGRAAMQLVTSALQVAQLDPNAGDNIDGDKILQTLGDAFGADPSLIRDPQTVASMRSQRAQAQQTAQQLQNVGQATSIAAEAAHAAQAATLSQGRVGQGRPS